ncbi:MAG: hypothetical protein Q9226_003481 [Calogaya cf. arnoldii]
MADIHQQELATRTASLLNSGEYSDLIITCGNREFKVHRNIVLPACKVLATACSGEYKAGTGGPIDLSEDDPNAVERMLRYLYTGNYDDTDHEANEEAGKTRIPPPTSVQVVPDQRSETSSIASDALEKVATAPVHVKVSTLTNNVLVYSLADFHDLPLLKNLAQTKFEVRAADEWSVEDIITVLPIVYATTLDSDRGLRRIMQNVCLRSMDHLMCHKGFRSKLKGDASMCFDVLDAVQMRSEERDFDNDRLKGVDAKFKRVIEWTKAQERVFKSLLEQSTACANCSRSLEVSVSNGATTGWQGPLIVKCRHCRAKLA